MANFDADIFSHGRLFWPIPAEWRPYAEALNQEFILPIGNHKAWVSAYLPINAALRAVVGLVADPALTSPLFVGAGAIALWQVAKHLWPEPGSERIVAMLLYAGSSQVVLTGMTSYAMSGHLALNLIWLALFLHNRPASHAAALIVGFLATGLHQPLFHPLFVLPFMWLLFRERRWRLMMFYGLGYGLICLFWLAWPVWISSQAAGQIAAHSVPGTGYVDRLLRTVRFPGIDALWLMALNLARFVTWQHVLLMPLVLLGVRMTWRGDAIGRALAASLALPVAAMLILLPYQGHGWGYRYMHGVIGSACLLGAYGWRSLESEGRSIRRAMLWSSAITLLLLIPTRAWMTHRMVAPYAEISAMIDRSGAQIAIIDEGAAPFAQDIVFNRPDLSNKPVRLMSVSSDQRAFGALCWEKDVVLHNAREFGKIRRIFGNATQTNDNSRAFAITVNCYAAK
ncbi:hypothetical protein HNQ99_000031 [Rhizorhapis suberifaciens]|uniref:DUF2723 domain-containing protein n=1 Tax=Rhizorhapis suberifaciens TaxID=13656 RepID=A0A840HPV5_9SPHN|nr:hypothetical protein [Rhizorhapis suberifaciens]